MSFAPIPARMLNELAYCPRLYGLEHVAGEWADSDDTVDGRRVHRKVDQPSKVALPPPRAPETEADADPQRPRVARSVDLADEGLGIVARIDLVEAEDGRVIPVDYKRGRVPEEGAWEPERVQVCAQVLLLRAHGYDAPYGELYFAGSKRRVRVDCDDALVARTLALVTEANAILSGQSLPPPLVDSPKCPRCSLVGICLPDEQNLLLGRTAKVRPMMPARDDALPLYVRAVGGSVGKDHDEIVVREKGEEVGRARLEATSRVVILGNVTVSTPLLRELSDRGIPVSVHGYAGNLVGMYTPSSGVNVIARIAQHRAAADPARALALARGFVKAKILNSRVLLRRNGQEVPAGSLESMKELASQVDAAPSLEVLMGVEGMAARHYFASFDRMLTEEMRGTFRMDGRNRRPPRDPVNALLSFAYSLLLREVQIALTTCGLDAWVGFLHQPRHGKPALALDLMEEFRPILADSAVINAINNGVCGPDDFVVRPTGCSLTDTGRRGFIRVFERRIDEEATHPVFGTRLSYRRILEVQARLLAKLLLGDIDRYPGFVVR